MKTIQVLFILLLGFSAFSQENSWTYQRKENRSLLKNEGQFDAHVPGEKIEFGCRTSNEHFFFTANKVHIHLRNVKPHERTDEEIRERAERKKSEFNSYDEWVQFQKEGRRHDLETDVLITEWVNANPEVEIIGLEENAYTYSFLMSVKHSRSIDGVKSYNKIIYKNIYPFIDIEYIIHPLNGIKYSVILHPGANPADVQLKYSGNPQLLSNGTIATPTKFGDIIDMAPITFYQGDENNKIESGYVLNGNIISFSLDNYDATQTAVIDPWTNTPAFNTNWDCVWECETDAAGNIYFIGGADNLELRKFNAAGTQQWAYTTPYDTSSWLGTMVTDNAGNTYVTQGSVAAMIKVNSAGGLVWSVGNVSGQLSGEFWNLALNCDQTRIVTAGTGGGIPPQPYIYDINPATGALISSLRIGSSSGLFSIEEVRSITATENEKYYWLTHDSIGYVSQVLNICPATSYPVKTSNGYNLSYKCENFRYNNTGLEAIAYYNGYAYVNRGTILDKRDFATGASVATATITGGGFSGGAVQNSGIAIDNCGNIYVGSKGRVLKFNTSLTLLATYTTTNASCNIYDVAVGTGGEIVGVGSTGTSTTTPRTGYVQTWAASACAPYTMVCCNASVCNPGPLCVNDLPVTLTPEIPGGTWSSAAPGFNAATGTFDPAAAGVGSYTVTYTQACGSSTLTITVIGCVSMIACLESNGNITVSGGNPTYTWTQPVHTVGCVSGIGAGCTLFDKTGVVHSWATITTGVTITPPVGADTITVTGGMGETFTTNNYLTLPACSTPLPIELIQFHAKRKNEIIVELEWQTASETDNLYYYVTRSTDYENWTLVKQISGSGTTSAPRIYHLTDPFSYRGIVYYRLFQMDVNGITRMVGERAVNDDDGEMVISEIVPNPANEQFKFIYQSDSDAPLEVTIFNTLGEIVSTVLFENINTGTEVLFQTTHLPTGVYLVKVTQDDFTKTSRVVIGR